MPFITLDDLESRELLPGFHGRMIHTAQMTASFWRIEAGAELPEHLHPHEQISIVLEGQLELRVGDETQVLTPGLVAVIPGNTPHAGRALTDCRVLDMFQPPRDDYK